MTGSRKHSRIGCVAAAMWLAASQAGAADTVRIGTDGATPPYMVVTETGALEGFEKALGDALCRRIAIRCDWVVMDRQALFDALSAGDIDAVMAAVPTNAGLGEGLTLSMAYVYPDPFSYLGRTGETLDFAAGKVAIIPDPDVRAWEALTGRSFFEFETVDAAVAAVRAGELSAVFAEKELLAPVIAASDGALDYVYTDQKVRPGVGMVFRSEDADLRFRFEDEIFEMSEDGSLTALTELWFGIDAFPW